MLFTHVTECSAQSLSLKMIGKLMTNFVILVLGKWSTQINFCMHSDIIHLLQPHYSGSKHPHLGLHFLLHPNSGAIPKAAGLCASIILKKCTAVIAIIVHLFPLITF